MSTLKLVEKCLPKQSCKLLGLQPHNLCIYSESRFFIKTGLTSLGIGLGDKAGK
jgi:hypothetical protein